MMIHGGLADYSSQVLNSIVAIMNSSIQKAVSNGFIAHSVFMYSRDDSMNPRSLEIELSPMKPSVLAKRSPGYSASLQFVSCLLIRGAIRCNISSLASNFFVGQC